MSAHSSGPWMAHGPSKPTPDAPEGGDWCIQDGDTNVIAETFYRVSEGAGGTRPAAAPAPRADEPATLNLGAICGRLGFTVSAQFLADVLHVQPARTDKASKLYTERQFAVICGQLVSHVSAMAELYAGEPA